MFTHQVVNQSVCQNLVSCSSNHGDRLVQCLFSDLWTALPRSDEPIPPQPIPAQRLSAVVIICMYFIFHSCNVS